MNLGRKRISAIFACKNKNWDWTIYSNLSVQKIKKKINAKTLNKYRMLRCKGYSSENLIKLGAQPSTFGEGEDYCEFQWKQI